MLSGAGRAGDLLDAAACVPALPSAASGGASFVELPSAVLSGGASFVELPSAALSGGGALLPDAAGGFRRRWIGRLFAGTLAQDAADARRAVARQLCQATDRTIERLVVAVLQRLVVVAKCLVRFAALLEREAREIAARAAEPLGGVLLRLDVLLHDREPPRLHPRALQIAPRQIVHHVHGVDHQLLVGRRLVGPGLVREHVLAEIVERAAREIEDLDLLVRELEVAARQLVVAELLQHHRAVEDEQHIVAAHVPGQLLRALHVHRLVQERQRAARLVRVQRGARLERLRRVSCAGRGEERRDQDQQGDAALCFRSEGCGSHGDARAARRYLTRALVSEVLFWNRMSLVSASNTCMNMKYCTRRSSSWRSSAL